MPDPYSQLGVEEDPYAALGTAGEDARRKSQTLGFIKGAFKPLDNAAAAVEHGLGAMGVPVDAIGNALGGTAQQAVDQRQQAFAQSPYQPGKIGEFAGNVVGTLPTLMLPGGAMVQGAAGGALLSNHDTPGGVAQDVALGAAGGKLGDMAFNALGTAAKNVSDPAVKLLRDAGVKMTPGQMLGGAMKAWEDKATSQPFVGGMIQKGRESALDGFNAAGIQRALDPIGETLSGSVKSGHDAVAQMGDKIGAAYDALIPNLKAVRDPQLDADLVAIKAITDRVPDKANQIAALLKSNLMDRFDSAGQITGQALKDAQKSLAYDARRYGMSQDPDQQMVGEAMDAGRKALLAALERHNPASREALRKADTAFANGLRVEKAASMIGAKDGRFTPQQLASAVKAVDSSGRKVSVSRGQALMQDLSKAGQTVLQSALPDSGTASRAAVMNPVAMLMGGAGAIGYQGAKATAKALEKLPPQAAAQLKRLAGPGGFLSGTLALQARGE